MFSDNGKPLQLPLIRGGSTFITEEKLLISKFFSILIKSRRIARFLNLLNDAYTRHRQLKLLRYFFLVFNNVLTRQIGLRIGVCIAEGLDASLIIFIVLPSTLAVLVVGLTTKYALPSALLTLAILFGRGIETITDPYEKCRILYKYAEQVHNKQLRIEMKNINSIVETTATSLQFQVEEVHVACVEQKLSLFERYKLREVIKSPKARRQVKHFSEFIKKFPECDADPKAVYAEIVDKTIKN